MVSPYKTLTSSILAAGTSYQRPVHVLPESVTPDRPALEVMTDLSKVSAMTIGPYLSLDEAKERMIATSVRLLFVVNQYFHVIGIMTSKDLAGDKAMKYLKEMGGKREDIIIRDLMTPQHQVEVLDYAVVAKSRVGDLVETLKCMGRQHALVVENTEDGHQIIRGVLSATQIGKQLGIEIDTSDVAGSFAALASR